MPELQQIDDAKFADMQRYASAIVTLGIDPDDPSVPLADITQMHGRRRICLRMQAAMLRRLADQLDAAHGPDRC